MYTIVASPTFKLCLTRLVHFLDVKYSAKIAYETKQKIKASITKKFLNNPNIAPISERLIDLGIKEYRQYVINNKNIVYYRVDEKNKLIILLAAMDSRQSIQKLLSEVLLLS